MKKIIIVLVVLILAYIAFTQFTKDSTPTPVVETPIQNPVTPTPEPSASSTADIIPVDLPQSVIGKSVKGRDIDAFHFGTGATELVVVAGVHGGYSSNTTVLAYELIDFLKANESAIPEHVKVTVIPMLNPDGVATTFGSTDKAKLAVTPTSQDLLTAGRFNGNTVDLNRNFDCEWQSTSKWQDKTVSGGSKAFSEPESAALKMYVEGHSPAAVVAYYSAAGGVYASQCGSGISAKTSAMLKAYATASGYTPHEDFDAYETSGDMTNWLSKINIPAVSVLLTNHTSTEWTKNKAGFDAVLALVAKK